MERYGLPKGLVWFSSERHGGRALTENEVVEKLAIAEQVEDVLMRVDPAARAARAEVKALESAKRPGRHRTQIPDKKTHHITEAAASITPARKRAQRTLDGFVFGTKTTNAAFVFEGSHSSQQAKTGFSFTATPPGDVEENQFCSFCQFVIEKARAIGMRPNEGARGGFSVYVEPSCECAGGSNAELVDIFPLPFQSLAPIHKAAEEGCHLCSLLVGRENGVWESTAISQPGVFSIAVIGRQSYDGPGRIVLQEIQETGPKKRAEVDLSYDASTTAKLVGSARYKRTNTESAFSLAQSWLQHCRVNHKTCRESARDDGFLPTRLLEINACNGVVSSMRLILAKSVQPRIKSFLALSHCWGGSNAVKLESNNLAIFKNEIPTDLLPKNFMDAAQVTTRLGFKYLWIDSLCIIQDSDIDKAREIPTMSGIYGRAVLTIAAMGAGDSNGGCFTSRYPLSYVPALLRDGDRHIRDQVWAWTAAIRGPDAEGDLRPPLHRRGWVVQERALATRTLSFGADMLHWECIEGVASEASQHMSQASTDHGKVDTNNASLKAAMEAIYNESKKGNGWKTWESSWWRIVREYTSSQLTYNSDKWNAISALVTDAERSTGKRLYYGLWECNLLDEMLWRCWRPGNRISPSDLCVPSWSWLSVHAPVHEQRFNYEKAFEATGAAKRPPLLRVSADTLGSSNKLLVHASLFNLVLRTTPKPREGNRHSLHSVDGNGQSFTSDDYIIRFYPDTKQDVSSTYTAILPLVRSQDGGHETHGLVVTPKDASRQSWCRVGCYTLIAAKRRNQDCKNDFTAKKVAITLV